MKTILDLVRSAARKANIIAAGEELEGSQGQDGLECLNYILDGWALQRLNVYRMDRITIPLGTGLGDYTIGATGDVIVDLPARIEPYADFNVGGMAYRARLERDIEPAVTGYAGIAALFGVGALQCCDQVIRYAQGDGLWTFTVDNVLGADSLVLYAQLLPRNLELSDQLHLPQGYAYALILNLALHMIEEYGMSATPALQQQAAQALLALQRGNAQPLRTLGDLTLRGLSRGVC